MNAEGFRTALARADRADQQKARRAITKMLATGEVADADLALVATTERLFRCRLGSLTIDNLVAMGFIRSKHGGT